MSITIIKYPKQRSFIENSIVFETLSSDNSAITVEVFSSGITNELTYYPVKISETQYKTWIDVSDYVRNENVFIVSENEIITEVLNFASSYQVNIGDNYSFTGIAFSGGLSHAAYQKLAEKNYDIFLWRLQNYERQFLFTTRTNKERIRIRLSELSPFIFIHPGVEIMFKSLSGNEITTAAKAPGTVCAMNIQRVYDQLGDPNEMVVSVNGNDSFIFVVEQEILLPEKYVVEFKNSLGAFEKLELTGRASRNPEFSENESWDEINRYNFYEERRNRQKITDVIEVESGYRYRDDFDFLKDMIQSSETYLIFENRDRKRCNIICENLEYKEHITEPTSVLLKIRDIIEEKQTTPEIDLGNEPDPVSTISVIPKIVTFDETGGQQWIQVTITGLDTDFSIGNLPPWLSVSGKTENGFYLVAQPNTGEDSLNWGFSVYLTNEISVSDAISVEQIGTYLTEIIFDVETTQPNQTLDNVILLSAQNGSGIAEISWDILSSQASENVTITEGTELTVTPIGGYAPFSTWVGNPIPHTYSNLGLHRVKVRTKNGVNGISFTPWSPSGGDWSGIPIDNPTVKKIVKFQSETLTDISKTFAGLSRCSLDEDFVLETPNVTSLFMSFAFFASDYANVDGGNFQFPASLLSQLTGANMMMRTFFNAGMEAIKPGFLNNQVNVVELFETFRNCANLGYNWCAKMIDRGLFNESTYEMPPFIPVNLLRSCHLLKDITGMFNWVGQGYYGNYPSGYLYCPLIRKDFFLGTVIETATFAFNKWTNVNVESDLFGHIKNTLKNINCIFYGAIRVTRRVHYSGYIANATTDLNELFPDASYPNIVSMAGAFETNNGQGVLQGFNCDMTGDGSYSDGYSVKLDTAAFVVKFPNCTATSLIDDIGALGIVPHPTTDGMQSALGTMVGKSDNLSAARPYAIEEVGFN